MRTCGSTRGTPHTRSSQCGHGEDDPEEADLPQSLMEWPSAFGRDALFLFDGPPSGAKDEGKAAAATPPSKQMQSAEETKKCPANLARAEWV